MKFFTHGIWMCIEAALPEKKRDDFRQFFGEVFEHYCRNVLKHVYDTKPPLHSHRLLPPLKFDDNAQVCDAFVESDSSWVIMEMKGVLITPRIKYGSNVSEAKKEIDSKFVGEDRSGKRKAALQLARSIRRLLTEQMPTAGDLDITRCKNIYPVVVCYDVAVGGKVLTMYLEKKFREALGDLPPNAPRVRPLAMLTIVDLELFTAVGRRMQLPHLLSGFRDCPRLNTFKNFVLTNHRQYLRPEDAYTTVNLEIFHENVSSDFLETALLQSNVEASQETTA